MARKKPSALVLVWNPGWAAEVADAFRKLKYDVHLAYELAEVSPDLKADVAYVGTRAVPLAEWPALFERLGRPRVLLLPAQGLKPFELGEWIQAAAPFDVDLIDAAQRRDFPKWLGATLADAPAEMVRRKLAIARLADEADGDTARHDAAKRDASDAKLPLPELGRLSPERFQRALLGRYDGARPKQPREAALYGAWTMLHGVDYHGLQIWLGYEENDGKFIVESFKRVGLKAAAGAMAKVIAALGEWSEDSFDRSELASDVSAEVWLELEPKLKLSTANVEALQRYCRGE